MQAIMSRGQWGYSEEDKEEERGGRSLACGDFQMSLVVQFRKWKMTAVTEAPVVLGHFERL